MNTSFGWNNPISHNRRELVFENRNQKYGAYVLRKNYSKRLLIAFTITVSLILILIGTPIIISFFSDQLLKTAFRMSESINLEEPPPIDKVDPPPQLIIPPPVAQTVKFTPPKVVRDEEAEDPPPTQEEVKNERPGLETREGIKDIIELPPDLSSADDDKIFTVVEEMPTFPGGEAMLFDYLSHIRYPPLARENEVSGFVYLNFIIDKDGKIKDAKVMKGIGSGCDEEALRVILAMPDWKPGRQNGRTVQVRSNIRVNFNLK